jgi:hypothetical protein
MNTEQRNTAAALDKRTRRAAKDVGLIATKSKYRRGTVDNRGQYQLVDPATNEIVAGARYSWTAEQVIAHCAKISVVP